MLYPKNWTIASLCWFLALPWAFSQNTDLVLPKPKWEFGIRTGAGFNYLHLSGGTPNASYIVEKNVFVVLNNGAKSELYLGAYATRYFASRWSLRSELSIVSTPGYQLQGSLGAFSRYRINKWLQLEAGLETRSGKIWGAGMVNKFTVGAVLKHKNLEFNMRFAPSYQPAGPFNRNDAWFGSVQAGVSVKLASLGKLKPKK